LAWTIEVSDIAEKQLKKLDRPIQKRLIDWLDDRINGCKTLDTLVKLCVVT